MKNIKLITLTILLLAIAVTLTAGNFESMFYRASTLSGTDNLVSTNDQPTADTNSNIKVAVHRKGIQTLNDLMLFDSNPELFVPDRSTKVAVRTVKTLLDLVLQQEQPELFLVKANVLHGAAEDVSQKKEVLQLMLEETARFDIFRKSKRYAYAADLLSDERNIALENELSQAKSENVKTATQAGFLNALSIAPLNKAQIIEAYQKENRQIVIVQKSFNSLACLGMNYENKAWKIDQYASKLYAESMLDKTKADLKQICETSFDSKAK